jgi:hypothetical protein
MGRKLLAGLRLSKRGKYGCARQMYLGFIDLRCQAKNAEIEAVAVKFMSADFPRTPENIVPARELA